jgi:subtilisin family serine protease
MRNRRRSVRSLICERLEGRELFAANVLQLASEVADTDSLLVQFRDSNVAQNYVGKTIAGTRLSAPLTNDGWYTIDISAVSSNSPSQVAALLAAWQAMDGVLTVTPDFQLTTASLPNDPSFSSLWGLVNTGASGGTLNADINIEPAWNIGTSSAIVTAVIDTGVDYTHPDLAPNMWANSDEVAGNGIDDDRNGYIDDTRGWDFANNDNNPMDDNGHGTHVAGTIGAVGNNGVGVTGVAWSTSIMALKFLDASGSGALSNAIRAIDYARVNGAKVINASWGGGGFSSALQSAISQYISSGGIFVAAAGNENNNNDTNPSYPANYTGVISVGASTRTDTRASFSNFGTTVDVVAPGQSILSTLPGNRYGTLSGTSMATPHVAGAIALLWGQNPTLSATTITQGLLNNTDNVLRGSVSQFGRINVGAAAVALRAGTTPPAPPEPPAPPTTTTRSYSLTGNFAIADATRTAASVQRFSIDVTDDNRIQDLDVVIQLRHTYASDLVLLLIAPDGTTRTLINRRGGSSDDMNVTLSDEATVRVSSLTTIRGTAIPEAALSIMDGKSTRGRWTLEIRDVARGDVGTLQLFRLNVVTAVSGSSSGGSAGSKSLNGDLGSGTAGLPSLATQWNTAWDGFLRSARTLDVSMDQAQWLRRLSVGSPLSLGTSVGFASRGAVPGTSPVNLSASSGLNVNNASASRTGLSADCVDAALASLWGDWN